MVASRSRYNRSWPFWFALLFVLLLPAHRSQAANGIDAVSAESNPSAIPKDAGVRFPAKNKKELARQILADDRLNTTREMALRLLTSFTAGSSYGEVWIRDLNTFVKGSIQVAKRDDVKGMLLLFFQMQGDDGNVPDGVIKGDKANAGYKYIYSPLAPGWAAHKNTVETDQESSLIQAIRKYVDATGDREFLSAEVGSQSVLKRMERALEYVLEHRWSKKYGLVTGATTVDWGDVQPEEGWGVVINDKTHWAIDIYDNAMFLSAINDFRALVPKSYKTSRNWGREAAQLQKNIRRHLWNDGAMKYIPHIYLNGSPFSANFNENEILYTGGTACAILAGLHNKKEIAAINQQFVGAAATQKHATIGMTVIPPYPKEEFPNMAPFVYQNGGDWTWFGGRMIQALILNGFTQEAYSEMSPMLDRVLKNKGFFEWYDVRTGEPNGSGEFRGEAGVLFDAIEQIRAWARNNAK